MNESLQNGAPPAGADVEMQDEAHSDLTDPNPPPQAEASALPLDSQAEHLSPHPPPPAATVTTPVQATTPTRPGSLPPQPAARPEKPIAHGGPTRRYLNINVTPHLLEGMKYLAAHEPDKPLQWLSEFLREKSREVEGT